MYESEIIWLSSLVKYQMCFFIHYGYEYIWCTLLLIAIVYDALLYLHCLACHGKRWINEQFIHIGWLAFCLVSHEFIIAKNIQPLLNRILLITEPLWCYGYSTDGQTHSNNCFPQITKKLAWGIYFWEHMYLLVWLFTDFGQTNYCFFQKMRNPGDNMSRPKPKLKVKSKTIH